MPWMPGPDDWYRYQMWLAAEAETHGYGYGKGCGKAWQKGKGKSPALAKGKGKIGGKGKSGKGKQPKIEEKVVKVEKVEKVEKFEKVDDGLLKGDEVGGTPTPASPSATGKAVNLRKVRGEKRAPQLRSIQRLARCVESGDYAELPQGYAWLAVGLEPSSCMEGGRPHLIEILTEGRQPQAAAAEQKQIEKLNAEQPPAGGRAEAD